MAKVDHVPVGHFAIDRRVLTHGGDDDAIVEPEAADVERLEQPG